MRAAHLGPAIVAVAIFASIIAAGEHYATNVENRSIDVLAPLIFNQKNQGSAIQRAALGRSDILPVYGSSELLIQRPYQRSFHVKELFRDHPNGFAVCAIGKAETADLVFMQKMAALGTELRGKPVVFLVTPAWFFNRGAMIDPASYAGNFSLLHAGEFAFSTDLSRSIKQQGARRMLQYPATLERSPLLGFALKHLAGDTLADDILYKLALPLGKLSCLVLRLEDHWESLAYIRARRPDMQPQSRSPAPIDWAAQLARAKEEYRVQCRNNPFGFDDERWNKTYKAEAAKLKGTRSDTAFARDLQLSKEWTDLDLLLESLKELGARPLILSTPLHAAFYDFLGVSASARSGYYRKLRAVAWKSGATVIDFEACEGKNDFLIDYVGHLSPVGWVDFVRDRCLLSFNTGRPGSPRLSADLDPRGTAFGVRLGQSAGTPADSRGSAEIRSQLSWLARPCRLPPHRRLGSGQDATRSADQRRDLRR